VAKRILDRDGSTRTIELQSEGEESPLVIVLSEYSPHRACLPSALFVDLAAVCTFGFVIKRRCDLDGGFLPALAR
jgi:hypothetical protein